MAWSKKYRYANGSENCGSSGTQQRCVQSGDDPAATCQRFLMTFLR
jgi:hypothetical protein